MIIGIPTSGGIDNKTVYTILGALIIGWCLSFVVIGILINIGTWLNWTTCSGWYCL